MDMKTQTQKFASLFLALAFLFIALCPTQNVSAIPVTGDVVTLDRPRAAAYAGISSLSDFAATIQNGNSGQIVGLYAESVFALRVVQQPSGNAGYVSTSSNVTTQFGMASDYGSVGMLAHNYLAGSYFSALSSGKEISVIYGDGSTISYTVSEVRKYQALNPSSAYSNFVNLSDTSTTLTSGDVFNETYGNGGALVLQTCISNNGNSSWGRLFVIAYKS
jgi:hypothetical protein